MNEMTVTIDMIAAEGMVVHFQFAHIVDDDTDVAELGAEDARRVVTYANGYGVAARAQNRINMSDNPGDEG